VNDTEAIAQQMYSEVTKIVLSSEIEAMRDAFIFFIEACLEVKVECPPTFIGFPCSDKIKRTSLHKLFKDHPQLSKRLDSETQNIDGIPNIKLIAKHKRKELNLPVVYVRREYIL